MAKKPAKPFEQAYYPDLPNFDMGRIEKQQAPSLYDDIVRFIGQNWYGEDPVGMNKARRAVDVGQIAIPPVGLAIGANEITRNARQGKSPGEGLKGVLLSGILPIPGAKLGPEIEKAAKTIDLGGIKVPKSQLANDLKALKAKQQSTPQSDPYQALDTYFKENPLPNYQATKPGPYDDYYANTSATEDDLDKYFPGEIPDYHSLSDADISDLEQFVHDNKIQNFQEDQYNHPLPQAPRISHDSLSGIDTTHISSHNFDDFDIWKVGFGEGTIMEGSGIYSSNDLHVPDYYIRQFTEANTKKFPYDMPKQSAIEEIVNNMNYMGAGTSSKQAIASTIHNSEAIKNTVPVHSKDYMHHDKILKVLREWYDKGLPEGAIKRPYQYNVNLDADPAAMPEYRATLSGQPEKARRLIRDAYLEHPGMTTEDMLDKTYEELYHDMYRYNLKERGLSGPQRVGSIRFGKDIGIPDTKAGSIAKQIVEKQGGVPEAWEAMHKGIYSKLEPNLMHDTINIISNWLNNSVNPLSKGRGTAGEAAADVSSYLYKKGIPGHKYLPAEGAYGDQGTRNFVSYHHEYMKIIKKIKLALAAGIPTAVLASQYGQDNVDAAQSQ